MHITRRQESHTNKYIHWRSNAPNFYMTGAMKSVIYRAYDLCTLPEDRNPTPSSTSIGTQMLPILIGQEQ